MDYSSRERYRARRRAIAARRRLTALAVLGVVLLLVLAGALLRGGRQQAVAPVPTLVGGPAEAPRPLAPTDPPRATAVPVQVVASPVATAVPAPFFDTKRLMYEPGFYVPQIQAFLDQQPGVLKDQALRVGDREHSFAEVLLGQSIYYSVNPKLLLALLELQSGLVTSPEPSANQLNWAMGYHGDNGSRRGLRVQIRWAVRQLVYAKRDYREYAPLTYADDSSVAAPPGMSLGEYVLARALAPTTTPNQLPALLSDFLDTYTSLFGDPRQPLVDQPPPAEPFLIRPMERVARVTSFFDHDAPFLAPNGSTFSYWGRAEVELSYDGHDGWDYALAPPELALAAAGGEVVFAGNADDNCETRAVVIDHGNGYRTLYWHLDSLGVTLGQTVVAGEAVGVIGASGCAFGPHLHLGTQYLGIGTDPYGYCGAGEDPWATNPAGEPSRWLWRDRPSPCGPPPADAVLIDTDSQGFARGGAGWQEAPLGYGGGSLYVPSLRGADLGRPWELRSLEPPAVAVYRPALPAAGRYRVLAYVPYFLNGLDDATRMRYRIQYRGGEATVEVNAEVYANDWADLGTYEFVPSQNPLVAISNLAEAGQRGVWADAVIWLPAEPSEN